MRLDEALQHRWAGKDIKRKKWTGTLNSMTKNLEAGYLVYNLSNEDIDADDWEVVPKYVDWDEALIALMDHKIIIADDIFYSDKYPKRKHFSIPYDKSSLIHRHGNTYTWATCTHGIPLHWIGKTNFEILED